MGEEFMREGALVWLWEDTYCWMEGVCTDVETSVYTISCHGYGDFEVTQKELQTRTRIRINDDNVGVVDQISLLRDLGEPSLFETIRRRYNSQKIHSMIGEVLIVVNPYERLDVYGEGVFDRAKKERTKFPHVYGVAAEAMARMVSDGENQTVTVSGESGAGKTETAKLLLTYIMKMSPRDASSSKKPVLDSNSILEAFGNAKTIRNNNSSRFGKFIKMTFNSNNAVTGAMLETYMLEKSRVVTLSANERNYHIFYQMVKGVSDARLMELALERECSGYRYLAASGCYEVPQVDDAADYQEVLRSLESYNLGGVFTEGLECTLAAILHIGNVSFGTTASSDNALFEESESTIAYAAGLLGVDVDAFKESLTKRRMTVVGETIMVDLRVEQAIVCRDSLAKQLYSTSFDMLVEAIAEALAGDNAVQDEKFIGVLDIFGFEIFTLNTLEQFNINYANEKLQSYFNDDVFTSEMAMYKREGVSVEHFDFKDNKECLELIEGRAGMINLLNEECSLGDAGTGKNYLNKVDRAFKKSSYFHRPPTSKNAFTIEHFASPVMYTVDEFLDKNRETLRDEHLELLMGADNSFVAMSMEAFEDRKASTPAVNSTKRVNTSLCSTFKTQLTSLVNTLMATGAHFIKCIKPNEDKAPRIFNSPMCYRQLRNTGVMDVIKILTMGYTSRIPLAEFSSRYCVMLSETPKEVWQGKKDPFTGGPHYAHACRRIVAKIIESGLLKSEDIATGVSRVFLKDATKQSIIDAERYKTVFKHIIKIQCASRARGARKLVWLIRDRIERRNRHLSQVVCQVQALMRGVLVRWQLWDLRLVIQLRGALSRRDVHAATAHVTTIEREAARLQANTQGQKDAVTYLADIARRGALMCQLMVKQDRFLGNLRTGIARNNAVALNALLPNAGAIALLGHPTVIVAKKKLLQLYYQRALGVALVEYLETADAHKGHIDDILTAAAAEGMDPDFLSQTRQVKSNFDVVYGCRDRLRAALMVVDEVGMLSALREATAMRSGEGMDAYGDAEVRACLEMLRLIEMSRQVTGEEGAGRALKPRGPLLDARLRKCCGDVMAAQNSEDDDMEPFLRLVVRRACLLSDMGIEEEEAIRYYKWTMALSQSWTKSTVSSDKKMAAKAFRPQFFGYSNHRLDSNIPFMNKMSNSMEATYSLGAEGTEVPKSQLRPKKAKRPINKMAANALPTAWRHSAAAATSHAAAVVAPPAPRHQLPKYWRRDSTLFKEVKPAGVSQATVRRRESVSLNGTHRARHPAAASKNGNGVSDAKHHHSGGMYGEGGSASVWLTDDDKMASAQPKISAPHHRNASWKSGLRSISTAWVGKQPPLYHSPDVVVKDQQQQQLLVDSRKALARTYKLREQYKSKDKSHKWGL